MRDNESAAVEEVARPFDVDSLASQVVVGKARQVRDLLREGSSGILAVDLRFRMEDLDDPPVEGVEEGEHGELDDVVMLVAEARRLDIHEDGAPKLGVPGIAEPFGEDQGVEGAGVGGGRGIGHGGAP